MQLLEMVARQRRVLLDLGKLKPSYVFDHLFLRLRSPVRNNVCASISGKKYLALLIFNQKTVLSIHILFWEEEAVVSDVPEPFISIEIFLFHSLVLLSLTWWFSYLFWFEAYHKSISLLFSCKWIQGRRDG